MATNAGGFKIVAPTNAPAYVTLTVGATATAATVFSDAAVTSSLTVPITIPQGTSQTFYTLSGPQALTLSVRFGGFGGQEIADPTAGTALSMDLAVGEFPVYDYSKVSVPFPKSAEFGLLGQGFPVDVTSGSNVLATGVLNLVGLRAGTSGVAANIEYGVAIVGATLTAAQNLVGLYSAPVAGVSTLIGTCPDQSTNFTVLGSHKAALTVVGGQSLAVATNQQFYVGILSVGTTPPAMYRGATPAAAANYNLATASSKYCTSGSSLTALPATVTMSGVTASVANWAGIS